VGLGALKIFEHPARLPDRVAYRAQQAWLLQFFLALHKRYGILREHAEAEIAPQLLGAMWKKYSALLERDLANVERGLYPRELLFEIPLRNYLKALPALVKNAPAVMMRRLAKNFMDLPANVDLEKYPSYYRQNFHWQTDGYLSRRSAELYDVAVEMLFFGTADVMRRQLIPPTSQFLSSGRGRLLDVGCGTGRTALQLACALPQLKITGIDLSPYYLDVARENCMRHPNVSFLEANGEDLPFRDEYFDVVTSTFVMHELPKNVRRDVLAEMRRVLRPGGILIVEDSLQQHDGPELQVFMDHFVREYHEPYYRDYIGDPLEAVFAEAGFGLERVEEHFVSKLVVGRKV
jgi:ubiquinone/menaquinone biosynthesis C-methylase UbiE